MSARPSNYELFKIVRGALGALHPRSAEDADRALREMQRRLDAASDTFDAQAEEIEELRRTRAA